VNQQPVVQRQPWAEASERFAEFAARPHCVWLDTVAGATGYSILAAEPSGIVRSKGRRVEVISADGTRVFAGNPFDVLSEQLAIRRNTALAGFPIGAAIGYFGYDLKNFVEKLPANAVDDLGLPDCWFGFYDNLLVFDHAAQQVFEVGRDRRARRGSLSGTSYSGQPGGLSLPQLRSNFTRDSYRAAILRAKQYIAAGDIYQVNLSQRFQCGVDASATELYRALRESNPAPYCAYLDIGEAQILSTSPECFLNIRDRHVVTRPIKGTRARGATPQDDAVITAELLASPKDNAELVMITDLERNDLGRVCEFGSVRVSELVRVETYATVHHLVSTVEGSLRRDVSHVDCARACFPGGSITGAPKIRAMEIIDELEPHARGVYTGAIGFLGYNAITHLNIAIRTVVYQSVGTGVSACGQLTFHAGGGIVTDSEPDAEYDETFAKARGILNAIEKLRLR
jgi:para-aminobenzoate synthetase component 1